MPITLDRNLNSLTNTELQSDSLVAVPIIFLDFPSLEKYFAGSSTNIVIPTSANQIMPAATYVGVGGIASIATTEESTELKSSKLTVELNGLDSTYIALVLAEQYFAQEARLALVTLDSNHAVVGEPLILFKGFMSVLTTSVENKFSISVEISSVLADWERPRIKRYNTGTQQLIDGTDRGFDNVADLINKEVVWGA